MVTTTSLKVGESLSIGLYFNDNYQLPTTCNLIVFIGGVCVGNLFTQQPEIDRIGVYYTIRLSSQDTSKMRGYRDLIVILDDPEGFGNKKAIVGGILFDRLADEFITTSENQGYNMLIEMTVDQSIVSGNVELIEAIKGDKGEDAILPDGIVIDEDYVHTDNNYTDADKSLLSNALQSEVDPVYSLDRDRLLNTSGTNTGDQDLTGLVEKVPLHSLVPNTEIDKLAEYPELPEVPEGYYLADDGTFKALPDFVTEQEMEDYVDSRASGGGGALSLYLSAEDSTVAGFKKLKDIPDVSLQEVAHNVAVGETLMHEFLYTAPIATTIIDAGTHIFNLIAKINITAGNSSIIFRPFLRHLDGSKTTLFSVSKPIANTAFTQIPVEFPSVAIHCLETDTYGIGIYFSTTVNEKIVTTQIGDGAASYIVVPLALRHKNTRNKNEEAAVQHVDTTTVKNTLVEGDKVAILDSVTNKLVLTPKSNFGSQLLVDYTHTANKEVNVESIDFVTSVITATNHGLANNTQLFIANKLAANVLYPIAIIPTGLNTGTPYFVINKTDNTFQVSLTSGGAAVAITDKATKNYTKWHFETKATVNITNLANLKKCLIKTFGKCFDENLSSNYLRFKKIGAYILGSTGQVWISQSPRYIGSIDARSFTDITSKADLFSDHEIEIDFSLYRAKFKINGARVRSVLDANNTHTTTSNGIWVHTSTGDVDFDEIELQGVFNGFNIKIYSV